MPPSSRPGGRERKRIRTAQGCRGEQGSSTACNLQVFWILNPDQLLPDSRIPWGKSHSHPYYKFLFLGPLCFYYSLFLKLGFPDGSAIKILPAKQEIWIHSIPGWGRSPGEENGNPLQYSCLENPKDRGAWLATFFFNWSIIALQCCVSFCCYAN